MTEQTRVAELTDAEHVLHRVLGEFLHSVGWKSDDYLAAEVRQAMPWERDPGLAVESCMTLAGGVSGSDEAADALVSLVLLLDQKGTRAELLRAVLPTWLINQSAVACLLLGRALLRSGDYRQATALLLQGVTMDPTFSDLRRELGLALRHQHRINDAVLHLEMALTLRRKIELNGRSTVPNYPVLVAQLDSHVDIYFYKQSFYIMRREPDSVGARAIAGELFDVRRNASYEFARSLARFPLVWWLMVDMWTRRVAREGGAAPSKGARPRSRWKSIVRNWLRTALQLLALRLFARPIKRRAATIMEALEIEGERFAEPHPSLRYGGPSEPPVA